MATKAENTKKQEQTTEQTTVQENPKPVTVTPNISPELANTMLTANFDYIRKIYGIGKWSKCTTPETKKAFLKNYKKLIDSMNAMGEYL